MLVTKANLILGLFDMDSESSMEFSVLEENFQTLFNASNSSTIEQALDILIDSSKTNSGRSELASTDVLPAVLRLCQSLPYSTHSKHLFLLFKLLRNLCAGESINQNSFIQLNGVVTVSSILRFASTASDSSQDYGFLRIGLQVLANVSLAGEEHQRIIWFNLFSEDFLMLAKTRSQGVCDVLCMLLFACIDDDYPQLVEELCGESGFPIVSEIVRTVSAVGFKEDWIKLLISSICLEEVHLPILFTKLYGINSSASGEEASNLESFTSEQAFLLGLVSEILNERLREITIPCDSALFLYEIFMKAVKACDSVSIIKSRLPTGSAVIDVLGYSVIILRDICAQGGLVVDKLISNELLETLLCLLRGLEPLAIISRTTRRSETRESKTSCFPQQCPYIGFRRDVVAVIGNCAYRRRNVQDLIREKSAIFLILQQCVTDEENPFLREWGIWCVRNLLEGNEENRRIVAELEVQGTLEVPEFSELGLRVEVDPETRRARLVNLS